MTDSRNILITSGRSPVTLELARQLHHAGHKIYVADTLALHICRFSNAVDKSFLIRSPRLHTEGFIEDLLQIVSQEKIDLIIPVYEEAIYLSQSLHRFPAHCKVFTSSFELLHELHNKWLFNQKIQQLGLDAPKTHLLYSLDDVQKLDPAKSYAIKASYSRAGLKIKKLSPPHETLDIHIEVHNPWIAQEWLEGDRFCTYSVCHEGTVLAHAVYPVGYAVDGKGCIVFEAVNHEPILKWIQNFVKETHYTGQIAFDFFESDQRLLAIECNPRATSGAHLFRSEDRLDQAFLNSAQALIQPKFGNCKQLAIAMMIYGWKENAYPSNTWGRFFKMLFGIQDVVFSRDDLMPILAEPIVFSGIWLHSLRSKLSLPAFFMFDYEWNGDSSPSQVLPSKVAIPQSKKKQLIRESK